jgi:FkbM family methyltransferase
MRIFNFFQDTGRFGKVKNFIHYTRNHRIPILPETRKIGIVCTLIGWGAIAYIETTFQAPTEDFCFFFSFFLQFLAGTFWLFVASLFWGKDFLKIKEFSGKKFESQSDSIPHLPVSDRKYLIFWRGLIAIASYLLLSWSKSNSQIIDNSAASSTDAIMYALIMYFVLKIKIEKSQWLAIAVVFLGIFFIVSVNILGTAPVVGSTGRNIFSLFIALCSAASLAIIVLLNTVIIQHEPPLRVAFFQCLIGLVCAAILVAIWIALHPMELFRIDALQLRNSLISGTIYAVAILFFFNAFIYTEPFIIVILGYSLFPFVMFFSWINGHAVRISDIVGAVLIISGGLASILLQRKHDKKNIRLSIAGFPIYFSTLKDRFRALRQNLIAGRIGQLEYLAQRNEFNKLIFEYADEIKTTDIEEIEIGQGEVVFMLKPLGIKMLSDKGCRSAPLEILNFGSYEKKESSFLFQMIKDNNVVFDIGANVGWYSIQIASRFDNIIVHSFEPFSQTFQILKKNIKLNNLKNVVLHNIALGESEESADFYHYQNGTTVSSRVNLVDSKHAVKVKCQMSTIDSIVSDLQLSKLDLIKCDVEGSELSVINGGLKSIRTFLPIIYLELFHGLCEKFNYTPDDVIVLLEKFGYRCFKIYENYLSPVKKIGKKYTEYNFFFLSPKKHKKIINKFSRK